MSRLKDKYVSEVIPAMMTKFKYKSPMQIPRLEKVVLNMGVGEAKDNPKAMDAAVNDLTIIAGQRPVVTKAKKSISNFKLRQGMSVGCKVTLRSKKMYNFVDKLFNAALPRVRDFRGVSPNSFDGRGNYTLGIKDQLVFPEIDYDKVDKARGMDIAFVTTAKTDEEQENPASGNAVRKQVESIEGGYAWQKSMIAKQKRTPKYILRAYKWCQICGRPHAYLRKFRNMPPVLQGSGLQRAKYRESKSRW